MVYGEEKRKFPRAVFPCKVIIGSPVRLIVSHTENISEGGLRVMLEEKLGAYTNVGMEIFFEKERPLKCKGRIIWVVEKINPLEKKAVMYDTGIQFIDMQETDIQYIRNLVSALIVSDKESDDAGKDQ